MKTSENAIKLIEYFEGLRLTAYHDSVGVWTIGYGHTGTDVHPGLTITREQAEQFLKQDVEIAESCINHLVRVELNQNQFDALVDFVFNLGCHALTVSTLLGHTNRGRFELASKEFGKWIHAGGKVLPGLVKRREAERQLFLKA